MEDPNFIPFEGEEEEETDESPTAEDLIEWRPAHRLQSRRDHLHSILDRCFPEIGWKVNQPKRIEQVPDLFRACARHGEHDVLRLLATRLDEAAKSQAREYIGNLPTRKAANKLEQLRQEITSVNSRLISISERIQEGSALRQRVKGLLRSGLLVPDEQVRISACSLVKELRQLKKKHSTLIDLRDRATRLLFISEVYFAQREFINLQQKGRYKTLTPRIMANALAGIPFMGYRTSADICSEFEPRADGLQMEIFKAIEDLSVHYRTEMLEQRKDLVSAVHEWIEKLSGGGPAVSDIKQNRLILIRTVQRVEKRQFRRFDAVPYAVARLFAFLKQHRSVEEDLLRAINQFLAGSNPEQSAGK